MTAIFVNFQNPNKPFSERQATLFPGLFPSILGGAGKDPGNGRSRDHQTPEKLGCHKLAIA